MAVVPLHARHGAARTLDDVGRAVPLAAQRLPEPAAQARPALALRAGRAGAWFVPALLVLAAVVFCAWRVADPGRAWPATVAVLVVSCPWALSLAAPTALAAAQERLLRRGALALAPHVLETLERATHVVFDKTGTLTHGRPRLRNTLVFADAGAGANGTRACLDIAAALEADSPHPLAQALRAAAEASLAPAKRSRSVAGQGIEGEIGGRRYRIGSLSFVAALAGSHPGAGVPGGVTPVWLGSAAGWMARFDFVDEVRREAGDIVLGMRERGKTVMLLSGDDDEATQDVAMQVGIAHALGGLLPRDKLDVVRALRREGAVVALVGNGIDDAAVMKGADVSFAMGPGVQPARPHADCVLLGETLAPLGDAVDTAAAALRAIRQNLGFAVCYNLAAVPAAALGWIDPWMAGAGMAASSALVVLNAWRLRGGR